MKSCMSSVIIFAVIGYIGAVTLHHYPELQQHDVLHHKTPPIPIVKQSFQQSKEGYKYSYETGNGIHAQESGYIKNLGDKKHETIVQQGSVTYHDEHGHPITLTYTADEHGFHPQGAHLPTPPPIPEEIKKSLELHNSEVHQQQEIPQQLEDVDYGLHQYAQY